MKRMEEQELSEQLSHAITAATRGARIIIGREGEEICALIPIEDLAVLETVEDIMDLTEVRNGLVKAKPLCSS